MKINPSEKPYIMVVVGARPNFMKAAPIMREMSKWPCRVKLIHTGQHYSQDLSKALLNDLEIEPDFNLEVGSGSHAEQTAKVLVRFEELLIKEKPGLVVVVGDVNSTLACALAAAKLNIRVAHVEAGLRSFDRTMPEEINRLLTDQIADILFTTTQDASDQLKKEGIDEKKIHFVGNVMIDSLFNALRKVGSSQACKRYKLNAKHYALLTLHRPSNVDSKKISRQLLTALEKITRDISILFPMHPRTKSMLTRHGLMDRARGMKGLHLCDPIGYQPFVSLLKDANFVLTDSGGIQEETTALGVPCLTLRQNTERPITVGFGSNQIVGQDAEKITLAAKRVLKGTFKKSKLPPKWDGKAAERIVAVLREHFNEVRRAETEAKIQEGVKPIIFSRPRHSRRHTLNL